MQDMDLFRTADKESTVVDEAYSKENSLGTSTAAAETNQPITKAS